MNKKYISANKLNNRLANKKMYDSIMKSLKEELSYLQEEDCEGDDCEQDDKDIEDNDDLEEQALNELFGFGGSSVKKPAKTLSLENTDEENAELFIQWCGYFMSEAGNNVKKGLDKFFKEFGSILVKIPKLIVKGVLMLLSASIKGVTYGIGTVAAIILSSISMLIRMANSGIEFAKESLISLYDTLLKGIQTFYKWFGNKAADLVTSAKEKVQLWIGIVAGILMACASKLAGAAQKFGEFFKQICTDAKDKKDGAVFMMKTWLSTKSQEVQEFITNIAGNIKSTVVSAWNAMDKKVRKTYDNIASKLEDWFNIIKELAAATAEKIEAAAKAAKDFTIDKKDKALIWGIQKGVKGLSDKYTEDQVVALVRKCYNESLIPDIRGNYRINEAYFHKAGTTSRRLYENKKIRRNRLR